MNWYAILTISAVLVAASSAQEKKTSKDQKAEAKETEKTETETPPQRRQKPLQIPTDAKEIRPGLWRWVDKSGQPWIYWNSPFGVARSPEEPGKEIKPATQAAPEQSGSAGPDGAVEVDGVTIIEEGDSIRFERRTPFGVSKLAKKKSELTAEERRLWERARALKSAGSSPDSKK
jgi:hypothetical protein